MRTCKPGSVPAPKTSGARPYHLSGPGFTAGINQSTHHNETGEPACWNEQPQNCGIFDLSIRKVCRASGVTTRAVGSYPTISPLSASWRTVYFLLHYL